MNTTFRPAASLFVGNLGSDVNENNLYETFGQAGQVISIRVCRDAITGRSLGYAYVNFADGNDAERALDTLNYTLVRGRPCHIMWSQRDPSLRRSGVGNIFVKGLDPSIDSKKLHDEFSRFGDILSCRVMTDDKLSSKGYGFVHFENEVEAFEKLKQKATKVIRPSPENKSSESEQTTGDKSKSSNADAKNQSFLLIIQINDKDVTVSRHIPPKERMAHREQKRKEFTNLYVKNFSPDTTDEQFKAKFTEFGFITSGIVMRDESGKSRGFGFVNFKTHEEAQRALDAFQKPSDQKDRWYVARHQTKAERIRERNEQKRKERATRSQGVNLYVKNIGEEYDEATLSKAFSAYGTITSVKIQRDSEGKSRGFGYVCFSTPDEANKAIAAMHRKPSNEKFLYVSHFQSKEERRIYLDNRYMYQNQMRMNTGFPPLNYYYGQMPHRPRFQNMPYKFANAQVGGPNNSRNVRPNRPRTNLNTGATSHQIREGGNQRQNSAQGQNKPYKFAHNAKNIAPIEQQQQQTQQPAPVAADTSSLILSKEQITTTLSNTPAEQHKQLIGDQLYYQIQKLSPSEAPKITGMLLEMDISELILLLESPDNLHAKVNEAITLLKENSK